MHALDVLCCFSDQRVDRAGQCRRKPGPERGSDGSACAVLDAQWARPQRKWQRRGLCPARPLHEVRHGGARDAQGDEPDAQRQAGASRRGRRGGQVVQVRHPLILAPALLLEARDLRLAALQDALQDYACLAAGGRGVQGVFELSGGVLARHRLHDLRATGVVSHKIAHVIDKAVQRDPEVSGLVVLRHLGLTHGLHLALQQ
mmetsp:Transcript_74351/g.191831  ORF Transcript_74351/g.191831 Transcript_74351/m.191831 type:complete len:202 (-) Transcript_74351:67-672(-)